MATRADIAPSPTSLGQRDNRWLGFMVRLAMALRAEPAEKGAEIIVYLVSSPEVDGDWVPDSTCLGGTLTLLCGYRRGSFLAIFYKKESPQACPADSED
jgi:hypothetical protein